MPSKTIVAIICITILLTTALVMGKDGALLASGVTVISGLGGFALGKKMQS